MTNYMTPRREVVQARQYQGFSSQEFNAVSISGWVTSVNPGYTVTNFTADEQGFSLTIDTDVDGMYTLTGVVGDWLVVSMSTVERLTTDDIVRRFETI